MFYAIYNIISQNIVNPAQQSSAHITRTFYISQLRKSPENLINLISDDHMKIITDLEIKLPKMIFDEVKGDLFTAPFCV